MFVHTPQPAVQPLYNSLCPRVNNRQRVTVATPISRVFWAPPCIYSSVKWFGDGVFARLRHYIAPQLSPVASQQAEIISICSRLIRTVSDRLFSH